MPQENIPPSRFRFTINFPDFRDDGKCGPKFPLQDGRPAQCDPTADAFMKGPCCSALGNCGNAAMNCQCGSCTDFRKTTKGSGLLMTMFSNVSVVRYWAKKMVSKARSSFEFSPQPFSSMGLWLSLLHNHTRRI